MKKTLLFGLTLGLVGLSYGQCDIMGLSETMCLGDAPTEMTIDMDDPTFSGPGVSGNIFTPAAAGIGTHTINVEAPSPGYNVDEGIPYSIDPISGTYVYLSDDYVSGDLPIGFDFEFFGDTKSTFRVSSNGFITFSPETDNGCCGGELIPYSSAFEPAELIAICWDDLNPGYYLSGDVTYETIGTAPNRVLVVNWDNVRHYYSGPDVVTGQIKLFETTNCIEVHITTQNETSGLHTLGIQNASQTEAFAPPGKNRTGWTAYSYSVAFCPVPPCSSSIDVEVVAGPNVAGTADVDEVCLGEEVTLTASGTADEYDWGVGIEDGIPFTPETLGSNTFIVAGTDLGSGCVSTAMVDVFVHDVPYVYAGDDMSVCEDEEFTPMAVGDEAEYAWDNGAVNGEPMMQEPGTVDYTVTATNAGGCEATSSMSVESHEVPTGTGVVTMMTGDAFDGAIDFTPEGGTGGPYTFEWSNGATTEDIDALTVGTYTVTVSDGMCDSDVTFLVDSQAGVELNELDNITAYPNPVVDILTVDFDGKYNWFLYDAAGKIVASGQGNGIEEISMEEFEAGNYMIKIAVDGAQSTISVVKQ